VKIVTVLGARPQFVKAGSVSREILRHKTDGANITEIIVHTGQHYDTNMSDVFFQEMHIPSPHHFLGIGGVSHGAMTGQMIEKIEEVLMQEKPDIVMVYGDTNSTLAGAIAASKLHIEIAHVEAGLRSFNMMMPEEINRILTDRISCWLFCPTQNSINNLANEGIDNWKSVSRVSLVGDVMLDGALYYRKLAERPSYMRDAPYVLSTIHRAENTDSIENMTNIIGALNQIAEDKNVIIPMHPRTKNILATSDLDTRNLTIIEPVGYLNMVWLIDHSDLVITDSGGLQKEAFFFNKRCITLRDETEWIELVEAGVNRLVGADKTAILNTYHAQFDISNFERSDDLYGNGTASKLIVSSYLNNI